MGQVGDAAGDGAAAPGRVGHGVLLGVHRCLLVAVPDRGVDGSARQVAPLYPAAISRFLRSPPATITQPTWSRSQLDRVEITTAVAMKYSSQVGRLTNFFAAWAMRSTGVFLALILVTVRTLDMGGRPGNLRLE